MSSAERSLSGGSSYIPLIFFGKERGQRKEPYFFFGGGLGGGIILCRSLSKESELSQTKLKQARGEKIIEHKRSCVHLVGNRIVCEEITLGENTVLSD